MNYVAGFGYAAGVTPPPLPELELSARSALQAIETEQARTNRFLHDVVAQSLSGAGLQVELLKLDLQARNVALPEQVALIQQALEDALDQVRTFTGKDPEKPLTES